MTEFITILDSEVEANQPARGSTAVKLRDNPVAIAEGDATVPNASRVNPAGMKRPTDASQLQILAHQGSPQLLGDDNNTVRFFLAVVVVPGAYTVAGTRSTTSNNTVTVYVNDVSDTVMSGLTLNVPLDLNAGDRIRVDVVNTGTSEIILSDFRLLSEYAVPMCQCQFNRFKSEQSA